MKPLKLTRGIINNRDPAWRERSQLLYIGAQDGGATPLLVLGSLHARQPPEREFDITWYRSAPRTKAGSVRLTCRLD